MLKVGSFLGSKANGLGAELTTNSTFAVDANWTKETGWSIAGGVAVCAEPHPAGSDIYQDISITSGNLYKITFTLVTVTAGTVAPKIGSTIGDYVSSAGTYSQTFAAGGGTRVGFRNDETFEGTIDNISLRAVL